MNCFLAVVLLVGAEAELPSAPDDSAEVIGEQLPAYPPDHVFPDEPQPVDPAESVNPALDADGDLMQQAGEAATPVSARALALGGWVGGLAGVASWLPVGLVCCASAGMMASVYPLSQGDPTLDWTSAWPCMCTLGVFTGMAGWVLALGATLGAGFLTAGGTALGSVLAGGTSGVLRWSRMGPALLGLAGGVALVPASLFVAAASGVLPWAVIVGWISFSDRAPSSGAWLYGRWLALNAMFMGAVVTGLGLVVMASVLPWVGGAGAATLGALFMGDAE